MEDLTPFASGPANLIQRGIPAANWDSYHLFNEIYRWAYGRYMVAKPIIARRAAECDAVFYPQVMEIIAKKFTVRLECGITVPQLIPQNISVNLRRIHDKHCDMRFNSPDLYHLIQVLEVLERDPELISKTLSITLGVSVHQIRV